MKNNGQQRQRIGLLIDSKRVGREGYAVLADGQEVGMITSGTFSPTLQRPIAMAYVAPQFADLGQPLEVDIRGTSVPAIVSKLPFYKRT